MVLAAIVAGIFISVYTGCFPLCFRLLFVAGSLIALNSDRVSGLNLKEPVEVLLLAAALAGLELPQLVTIPGVSVALVHTARHLAAMIIVVFAIAGGPVRRALSHGICASSALSHIAHI